MKEQRYILSFSSTLNINGINEVIPDLDGSYVKNKEDFYNASLDANIIYGEDWNFDYLVPRHSYEYEVVNFICDFHDWIGDKPSYFSGVIISNEMKRIIEKFNLYPNKFYPAKVLFKGEYLEYFVWQFFLNGFDEFVDLDNSTFCEWKRGVKVGDVEVKVENIEELMDYEDDNEWWSWGFKRAVMKEKYKNIDAAKLAYPYGILISERLKNALEEAELTGFKITPFPVEFEYL
ncbi:hypothetical protein F7018_04610 [Tenacibaculum aiptasiae]|uniref:Uncharacterized protein n=1 Tax=Tenacibaculum aiptasiae TaxID=426481 RepID=A0A7J5AQA7_9FLAO|nr:hypothetical protein [Tenacibaculum aiptasiae]KAB1159594.1 hypothetical protein F7018_04610 [Tenacibaculum aiptasiae]